MLIFGRERGRWVGTVLSRNFRSVSLLISRKTRTVAAQAKISSLNAVQSNGSIRVDSLLSARTIEMGYAAFNCVQARFLQVVRKGKCDATRASSSTSRCLTRLENTEEGPMKRHLVGRHDVSDDSIFPKFFLQSSDPQ